MPLFINTTGGMKNLPVVIFIPSIGIKILILVLFNNILVFFDRRSPGLRGSEVPPPRVEALGSMGRRYGLHDPWGLSLRVLGIVPLSPKGYLA